MLCSPQLGESPGGDADDDDDDDDDEGIPASRASLSAGTKHEIATFICTKSKDLRRRTQDIPQFGSSRPRSDYSLITNFK